MTMTMMRVVSRWLERRIRCEAGLFVTGVVLFLFWLDDTQDQKSHIYSWGAQRCVQ